MMLSFPTMKVYLAALGCKLNESELETWSRQFAARGFELTEDAEEADLCVVNTCTVTHIAARKSRQITRQLARQNPNARLVLTGCLASMEPEQATRLPNVALVVPNPQKDRLVNQAEHLWSRAGTENEGRTPRSVAVCHGAHARTRAFVKVMDGCNMSCTYCVIPQARGREQSRPLADIVAEVGTLVAAGYKEVILTGVQISAYAHAGVQRQGLSDLVAAILSETDVARLRLSSIAPWDLDESLLDLWSNPRLCRHIHLSLQSGSDPVLRRMRRPYTSAQYGRIVAQARERIPDLGITTDIIVGFPGETDAEFATGLAFVQDMQFSRVHVFPYSPRAGTVAAQLPGQVTARAKAARVRQMQAAGDAGASAFASRFLGRTMEILWEASTRVSADGAMRKMQAAVSRLDDPLAAGDERLFWSGYTDNYIRVRAEGGLDLHNKISLARLDALNAEGATAQLV